jgi:hypothetical protein
MFKNLDNDNDIEVGHRCIGRSFREVPLVNLFEQGHEPLAHDEGFYSGKEEELLNKEHSESAREEEEQIEEPLQEELVTLGIMPALEVSIITPPVVLATLSNQSNLSY